MTVELNNLIGTPSLNLPEFLLGIPSNNGTTSSLLLANATAFEIQNLKCPILLFPPQLYSQISKLRDENHNQPNPCTDSNSIIIPDPVKQENHQVIGINIPEVPVVKENTSSNSMKANCSKSPIQELTQIQRDVVQTLECIKNYNEEVIEKPKDNMIKIVETYSISQINPEGILAVKESDTDFAILQKLSQRIMTEKQKPLPPTKPPIKKPKKPELSDETILSSNTLNEDDAEKEKDLTCQTCNKTLASIHSYDMHMKIHADVKEFLCKTCNKAFRWKSSFEAHMYVHRKGKPFKCNHCESSYTYKTGLDQHIINKHTNTGKIYKCDSVSCDRHFMSLCGLKSHQERKHQQVPLTYMCEQCGKSMASKNSLRVHLRIHTGEKIYHCLECNLRFASSHTLRRHKLKIHLGKWEKKFQCGQCGKLYYTSSQLRSHEIMHTDARPFKCKECDRTFRSYTHLRGHKNMHLGIKPHKCAFCPKTFTFYSNMLKHVKRHGTNKPFKCEVCPKSFFEKQELRKHLVSHEKVANRRKLESMEEAQIEEPDPVILDIVGNYSEFSSYQIM